MSIPITWLDEEETRRLTPVSRGEITADELREEAEGEATDRAREHACEAWRFTRAPQCQGGCGAQGAVLRFDGRRWLCPGCGPRRAA